MNLAVFQLFKNEVEKVAAPPLHLLYRRPLHTALAGAGLGAAYGAATAEDGDRIGGTLRGALGGAVVGGAGASAGRAMRDTQLLAKRPLTALETVKGTGKRLGEGVVQGVKRQLHGLSGAYANPAETGIQSSHLAKRREALVRARAADEGVRSSGKALKSEIANIRAAGRQGDESLAAGTTSLPGVIRGLAGPARAHTARVLGREITGRGGLLSLGGALGIGLPIVSGAADIAQGDESATGGRSLAQKVVGTGTNVGVGALTAGMPFMAGQLVSGTADALGQIVTRPKRREVTP